MMKKNDEMKKMQEAIGAMSEMGLISIRSSLAAGATLQEAIMVATAFMTAQMDSARHASQEQEDAQ